MDTKKWGPSGWVFLHSIAHNYDPAIHDRAAFKRFFTDMGAVLPCIYCRESYQEFIKELPIDDYLKKPGDLAQWLYQIHNKVNQKLRQQKQPIKTDPSFQSVTNKYAKFKVESRENCQNQESCRSRTDSAVQTGSGRGSGRGSGSGSGSGNGSGSVRMKLCVGKNGDGSRCRRRVSGNQKHCFQH